jgi:DNA invertase Pin-like site-specific DNA recombinase
MTKLAFSYIRFSSAIQANGDSYRRQLDETKRICDRNGWTLSTNRFFDKSVSGFDGKNQKRDLGRFIDLIGTAIPIGSVLVVEALDRLTRQAPLDALALLNRIINAGVDICSTMDNQIYTKQLLETNPGVLFILLGQLIRGRDESEKKSTRTKAWIADKKSKGERFTGRTPFWIALNEKKEHVLIPERVDLIKACYALALAGLGTTRIAAHIGANRSRVDNRPDSQHKDYATASQISHYLSNRAVTGALVVGQEVIPDYYPRIIADDDYDRVRALCKGRFIGAGRKGTTQSNLFSSLIYCHCGDSMRFCGTEAANNRYLKCLRMSSNQGCIAPAIRYDPLERTLLEAIYTQIAGDKSESNQLEINQLKTKIDDLNAQIDNMVEGMANATNKIIVERLNKQMDLLAITLQESQDKLDAISGKDRAKRDWKEKEADIKQWMAEVYKYTTPEAKLLLRTKLSVDIAQVVGKIVMGVQKQMQGDPEKRYRAVVYVYNTDGGLRGKVMHIDKILRKYTKKK